MITLSSIASRISELETEELSSVNAQLDTWYAMVSWQFFVAQYGNAETAKKVLYSLPNDHEMRITAGKLTWFMHHFASALPDTTWQSEKAEICFACWLEEAIEENYTESALSTEEALNDCLTFVSVCLTNGSMDFYDKRKKEEQETWQKKLEFRRQANFGELTPEASAWLEVNDAAFWLNFSTKKESKPEVVKPARVEAITPVLPEIKPEVPKPSSEFVTAHWSGIDQGWLCDTAFGTLPVYRNREYRLSLETWKNIQSDSYLRQRWHKVNNGA